MPNISAFALGTSQTPLPNRKQADIHLAINKHILAIWRYGGSHNSAITPLQNTFTPSYSWWIADPGAGLVRLGAALE